MKRQNVKNAGSPCQALFLYYRSPIKTFGDDKNTGCAQGVPCPAMRYDKIF
ncbi:MAG TPA: hypothetical protein PKY78_09290 [Candidatus Omnitrophota bacterium]|nr:hypothetical protein [Candidatus Omnitrophota bacterium]